MGGNNCKGTSTGDKPITIALLGLDNAGKTTTTRVLEKAPVESVAPTIGYSQSEVTHKNNQVKLIDLGGGKSFREAWRHYYDDAYGFVYVLDSSEEDRLGENRDVLKRLLQEEKVKGKPILILVNKQDKADALDKNTIVENLRIERLVNENQTLCRVESCTAKSINRSGKISKSDESIRHGFDWLVKTIYEHYGTLHKRVEEDIRKRNEAQEKEKRERKERVQRMREEREKEEGLKPDNDDDDDTAVKQGFVPIDQAVKNAERNAPKDKTDRGKTKSKAASDEDTPVRPIPAPRSASRNRPLVNDENSDEQDRPRRHSREMSPRRNRSPMPRSTPSNVDENERNNSDDEQQPKRPMVGKKKKVIGAGRTRAPGDSLPPLAPSSNASRREDFPQTKGPPVGTPRPQPLVAQWAITSPTPQSTADKLTTIASDNELDNDDNRSKSSKATKRIVSPHPITTNRINNERKNQFMAGDQNNNNNNDDDDGNNDEYDEKSKRTHSKEQERSSRQYRGRNDDDDENDTYNKRPSSSTRKSTTAGGGGSSSRSHSRTNGTTHNDDDDE